MVTVTETASNYWPVQTKSQNVIRLIFVFKGRVTAWAVSPWPIVAKVRIPNKVSPCEIYGGQSGTEAGFSPSTSVLPCQHYSTISPYSPSFKCCSYRWINGGSMENLQKTTFSRKSFFLFFLSGEEAEAEEKKKKKKLLKEKEEENRSNR